MVEQSLSGVEILDDLDDIVAQVTNGIAHSRAPTERPAAGRRKPANMILRDKGQAKTIRRKATVPRGQPFCRYFQRHAAGCLHLEQPDDCLFLWRREEKSGSADILCALGTTALAGKDACAVPV
ncbi:hypothetical protein GCM10007874_35240 [Labrys miyagiensis]|uniref:Uncharacterized protein n=1 Tax=Labrys miyagiensis TaxID=346912 RepID=A0ABQ6CJH5_9HYPH|nr:hypothetical protein GCM10007874_35240 [Labrys miyagiensis]